MRGQGVLGVHVGVTHESMGESWAIHHVQGETT